jgi:PBP1b-binding outer membrane lipoprotein LpoB
MNNTKQKTWLIIEIMMSAFLIISSCEEPNKPYAKNEKQLAQNIQPVFKPSIKTISITNTFLIYNP